MPVPSSQIVVREAEKPIEKSAVGESDSADVVPLVEDGQDARAPLARYRRFFYRAKRT